MVRKIETWVNVEGKLRSRMITSEILVRTFLFTPGHLPATRNTPLAEESHSQAFSGVSFFPTGPLCIPQDRTTGVLLLNRYKNL